MSSKIPPISIKTGTITEAVTTSQLIPEFKDPPGEEKYHLRLSRAPKALLLIAQSENKLVGFKVGYQRANDGSFYSWMGGVIPSFRRFGIARKLAEHMEGWAKESGYHSIKMKTRNQHRAMLLFALQNGFMITGFKAYPNPSESRIILQKKL